MCCTGRRLYPRLRHRMVCAASLVRAVLRQDGWPTQVATRQILGLVVAELVVAVVIVLVLVVVLINSKHKAPFSHNAHTHTHTNANTHTHTHTRTQGGDMIFYLSGTHRAHRIGCEL